jgi:ATP-binding cassette subfamily C protein
VITFFDEFARAKTATERLTEIIEATPEEPAEAESPLPKFLAMRYYLQQLDFHHPGRVDF